MATAAGRIGIETVVWSRGDDYAVAVNIDVARSRPRPGEVHRLLSVHFVAARIKPDLPRRRCCRRCWSWACGRELELADARKPACASGDRIIFVGVPET